jgi:hypothetical protein
LLRAFIYYAFESYWYCPDGVPTIFFGTQYNLFVHNIQQIEAICAVINLFNKSEGFKSFRSSNTCKFPSYMLYTSYLILIQTNSYNFITHIKRVKVKIRYLFLSKSTRIFKCLFTNQHILPNRGLFHSIEEKD